MKDYRNEWTDDPDYEEIALARAVKAEREVERLQAEVAFQTGVMAQRARIIDDQLDEIAILSWALRRGIRAIGDAPIDMEMLAELRAKLEACEP